MTPFWHAGWAFTVAIAWLLPNHYPPWTAFHMDAWIAVSIGLAATVVTFKSQDIIEIHSITLLTLVLVFIPGIQYGTGLILLSGTAWIATAYLLGFLLSLIVGAQWESNNPGQLADGLFLAIGLAAMVSVGLQLHQWLGLDLLNIWSMGEGNGRPFANIGQPNNLGTLLAWGLLATAWGVLRKRIGVYSSVFFAMYLLFGLALTQSRTAWLAVILLIAAAWIWKGWWPNRYWPPIFTGLGLYFAVCVMLLGSLDQMIGLTLSSDMGNITRISSEQRPAVWILFLDAAMQHPWLGYGWNQVTLGQLTASLKHPALSSLFSHSHNLFLDLALWCGIPLGLFISFFLIYWIWKQILAIRDPEDVIQLLLILVVGNHAMLEFPLHYAYFLLPTGLVMGALNIRSKYRPMLQFGRQFFILTWLVSSVILFLTICDYIKIESNYQTLRFEWARIETKKIHPQLDVFILNQWPEFIRLARFEPFAGMDAGDLQWLRAVVSTYPSPGGFQKLAGALALNKQPVEAQLWLRRACKIVSETHCEAIRSAWARQSLSSPDIATVPWP